MSVCVSVCVRVHVRHELELPLGLESLEAQDAVVVHGGACAQREEVGAGLCKSVRVDARDVRKRESVCV